MTINRAGLQTPGTTPWTMSNVPEKVRMTIQIAGEAIPLTVPFDRQDHVRDTEACVADLYDSWRQRFPRKTERELLAMMTYQFASYYLELATRERQAEQQIEQAAQTIDRLLGSNDDGNQSN